MPSSTVLTESFNGFFLWLWPLSIAHGNIHSQVLVVTPNSQKSHLQSAITPRFMGGLYPLEIPLVSDVDGAICREYYVDITYHQRCACRCLLFFFCLNPPWRTIDGGGWDDAPSACKVAARAMVPALHPRGPSFVLSFALCFQWDVHRGQVWCPADRHGLEDGHAATGAGGCGTGDGTAGHSGGCPAVCP